MFRPEKIGKVSLALRTQDVKCPELPDGWFDEGAAKVVTVRQLTGNEVATAQEAAQSRDLRAALAEAIEGGSDEEIKERAKDLFGRTDAVTPAYARKLETVRLGVVCDPPLRDDQVATLGEQYAWVLERLYLAVSSLTGKGAQAAKKPAASTPTKVSRPA